MVMGVDGDGAGGGVGRVVGPREGSCCEAVGGGREPPPVMMALEEEGIEQMRE
jgi:hypothetical protein